MRRGHALAKGKVTPARYASGSHVSVSRHGVETRPIDDALPALGLQRKIVAVVGGFGAALALALQVNEGIAERLSRLSRHRQQVP